MVSIGKYLPMKNKKYRVYLLPAIFLLAVALVYIGDKLVLSRMQAIGAAILGFGLVAVGLESIRARYFDIGVDPGNLLSSSRFKFRGTGAIFWGLLFLTLGLGTVAAAGVIFFDLGGAAERLLSDRPGIVIAPLGFIFLCTAVGWLSGDEQMNASVLMFIVTLPHRIGAVITLLFALAVLGVGLFELVAPEAFDQIVASLKPPPAPKVLSR